MIRTRTRTRICYKQQKLNIIRAVNINININMSYPCLLKYYYPIPGGHNSFFKKSIRKEIIDRISSFVKEVSLCKRDDDKDEDEDEDML